ncbi:MAG TPA: methyltransferase [Rhodospirillaceae bacterium]|nr:methyltransferase [Rhodospirillaceae bacterium]
MMTERQKDRITRAFSNKASSYDMAADVQWLVASRLAARIIDAPIAAPLRIVEIGCGTGFLSSHLAEAFPNADLLLTDIAASMLARCRGRIGDRARYQVVDGERPEGLEGPFDLIVSNLAFQWFVDLGKGIERLSKFLAPGGRMMFATLGVQTFQEWRAAHRALGLTSGTPAYPGAADFPWPPGFSTQIEEELLQQPYADGHDFVRSLKALGAGEPAPGHQPLAAGAMRRLLASLEDEFTATYHILYGELVA